MVDFVTPLQYIGTSMGVGGMAMVNLCPNRMVLALTVTALACCVMITYAICTAQWGIAASQAVYIVLNTAGIFRWRKKYKEMRND